MVRLSLKIGTLLVGLIVPLCWGQSEISQLEYAWQEDRFFDLKKLLPQAVEKYPQHPLVLFFQAFCEANGERAAHYYHSALAKGLEAPYADAALFRLAQYQYACGQPTIARRYFTHLYRRYSKSKWSDDAYYLSAQCYLVEGKLDSANRLLRQLIKEYPHSLFADLAVADLESTIWQQPERPLGKKSAWPQERLENDYWAIQVGAFAVRENAVSILKGLQEVGYQGEIVEKRVGDRIFHAVWIGRFKEREDAEAYAQRFIIKLTKEYHIVRKSAS